MVLQWGHEPIGFGQPTGTYRLTPILESVHLDAGPGLRLFLDVKDRTCCGGHGDSCAQRDRSDCVLVLKL